jgi:hypothetical protein
MIEMCRGLLTRTVKKEYDMTSSNREGSHSVLEDIK